MPTLLRDGLCRQGIDTRVTNPNSNSFFHSMEHEQTTFRGKSSIFLSVKKKTKISFPATLMIRKPIEEYKGRKRTY